MTVEELLKVCDDHEIFQLGFRLKGDYGIYDWTESMPKQKVMETYSSRTVLKVFASYEVYTEEEVLNIVIEEYAPEKSLADVISEKVIKFSVLNSMPIISSLAYLLRKEVPESIHSMYNDLDFQGKEELLHKLTNSKGGV